MTHLDYLSTKSLGLLKYQRLSLPRLLFLLT